MNLEKLINNPGYDLKDGYFTGDSKIEQFLDYKHDNKGYDFDVYKPVVEMYREAIAPYAECDIVTKVQNKQYLLKCGDTIYRGESMNSGGNILKRSLQLSEGYRDNCEKLGIKGAFSKNYRHFLDNIDKFNIEADVELLNEFLGLTHSMGDFIAVPEYFNAERNSLTSDYWDLALYNIELWYDTKNDMYLTRFLNEIRNNSKAYQDGKRILDFVKPWLEMFGSWESFVELNFLQPFVDENNKPVPFWDNHFKNYEKHFISGKPSLRKVVEPQSIDEVNQFLEKATQMIIDRGELISNYLKEKRNN